MHVGNSEDAEEVNPLAIRRFGTERPSTWTTAFVLDTPRFTRLCDEISTRFGRVGAVPSFTFTVVFRDKRTERRYSVEEVVNLENARGNRVSSVSIAANGKTQQGHPLSCAVEFLNLTERNVRLAVKGEDPIATNDIHAALDERVRATFVRNWGQMFALVTLVGILISVLWFGERSRRAVGLTQTDFAELNQLAEHAETQDAKLAFVFELHRREVRKHLDQAAPAEFMRWSSVSAVATSLLVIGVIVLLLYLAVACYPRAVFDWGDYGEHFQSLKLRRKYIRNLVIGGVILGLVVNLAATGIAERFSR